jgi:pimeloyl-ACP methyl ester carboxylesterase
MRDRFVETSHARIAVADSEGAGPDVLFIPGNSSCKEVFRNQLAGEIGRRWRCLAIDLPGHGKSADAPDPVRSYSMPGYAEAALEVLAALGVGPVAVIGWSLGGHIGIEMLPRRADIAGLLISGTPPVGKGAEEVGRGFCPSEHIGLAGTEAFTTADVDAFARETVGVNAPLEPFLREAVRRTDGRARRHMFEAFLAGIGSDQRQVVEQSKVPIAVINGAEDPFLNHGFFDTVAFGNLWRGTSYALEGLGHAPFWEAPARFDPLLADFLAEALPR